MIKIPNGELDILYANCICASFCLNWLESTVRSDAFPFVIKALYIERRLEELQRIYYVLSASNIHGPIGYITYAFAIEKVFNSNNTSRLLEEK